MYVSLSGTIGQSLNRGGVYMMLQIVTSDLRVMRFWVQAKLQSIFTEKINNIRAYEAFRYVFPSMHGSDVWKPNR